jgi:hypothetical protein
MRMMIRVGLQGRTASLGLCTGMLLLAACPGGGDGRETDTDTGIDSIGPGSNGNTDGATGTTAGGTATTDDPPGTTTAPDPDTTAGSTGPGTDADLLYLVVSPAR